MESDLIQALGFLVAALQDTKVDDDRADLNVISIGNAAPLFSVKDPKYVQTMNKLITILDFDKNN
jgi:hypothetical protein